jgi:hypothetical protein
MCMVPRSPVACVKGSNGDLSLTAAKGEEGVCVQTRDHQCFTCPDMSKSRCSPWALPVALRQLDMGNIHPSRCGDAGFHLVSTMASHYGTQPHCSYVVLTMRRQHSTEKTAKAQRGSVIRPKPHSQSHISLAPRYHHLYLAKVEPLMGGLQDFRIELAVSSLHT